MTAPDRGPSSDLTMHRLAPGADFLYRCAARILVACAPRMPDLSGIVIVVPNLMLPGLRGALANAAGRPLLLPRIVTLSGWADPLLDAASFDSPARRQMRLFAALRDWRMLDGNSRWQIADSLVALFDELQEVRTELPGEGAAFGIHAAAGIRDCVQRTAVVRSAIRACAVAGGCTGLAIPERRPPRGAAADHASRRHAAVRHLGGRSLARPARAAETWAMRAPAELFVPDRRLAAQAAASPLPLLAVAWPPQADDRPLRDRAAALRATAAMPLDSHVTLIPTGSLEALARHAALQVRQWLAEGRTHIALVAAGPASRRGARGPCSSVTTSWLPMKPAGNYEPHALPR